MKKRRSISFVDFLTYLAIVPIVIFLLIATGLAGSLVIFNLPTSSYPDPITPVIRAHLPTLTPTPLVASVAQASGQSDAVAPMPMARPISKPFVQTATPAPSLLKRLVAVVIGDPNGPATTSPHIRRLPTLTPTPADGMRPLVTSESAPVNAGAAIAAAEETPTPVPPGPTPVNWVTPDPVIISPTPVNFIKPTPVSAKPTPINLSSPTPVPASPTPTSPPVAIPAALSKDWSFANVRIISQGSVMVFGNMKNNSGSVQQISYVTGTFYDDQGQEIPGQHDTYDYWPVEVVPPGGQIPFQLRVYDIQNAGKVDLGVASQPSNQRPFQDFQISGTASAEVGGNYCVTGSLHNPGDPLQNYLMVVATIFNDQDKIINFDSDTSAYPADVVGDETFDFEVCVDPSGQDVVRYELRAFGQ